MNTTPRDTLAATIAANVRARRRRRRLTQRQLATLAKIHRQTVAKIEAGQLTPTLATLARLAAALECEPRALLAPIVRALDTVHPGGTIPAAGQMAGTDA